MTREPKIPMLPSEFPQQRIHEVVTLPERPAEFDLKALVGAITSMIEAAQTATLNGKTASNEVVSRKNYGRSVKVVARVGFVEAPTKTQLTIIC